MTSLDIPTEFPALKGKYVLLTGGSSGIGLAAAQLFTSQGAYLLIGDLTPPPPSANLPPSHSHYHRTDVTSWPSLLSLFTHATTLFPHLDVLLANAGIGEVEDIFLPTLNPDTNALQEPTYKVLDVNLRAVLSCSKLAVHHFRSGGRPGRIVLTCSTAGYMGETCLPVYSAAKHGLVGFMRSVAPSASKFGIDVSCVAPWFTESGLIYPELRAALEGVGVAVQEPMSVARAMAFAACGGEPVEPEARQDGDESEKRQDVKEPETRQDTKKTATWTNKTIHIASNHHTEIEVPLQSLTPHWLGPTNAKNFSDAQKVRYFERGSGM